MAAHDKHRRGWRLLIELAALILLVLALRAWQQRELIAGPAPPLQWTTLNGRPFSLSRTDDRPTLVYFWASWCPVCKYQTPAVAELARDHRVISVAMQSGSAAEVYQYLQDSGLDLPTLNDPEGVLSSRWGIRGVPATFILDNKGAIRFREAGYTTGPGLRFRLWLAGH